MGLIGHNIIKGAEIVVGSIMNELLLVGLP